MKAFVVAMLFCFVLSISAIAAQTLSRHDQQRNTNLDRIVSNIRQTKCGRNLVQNDEYHKSKKRVFDHLSLNNAEKHCLQNSFGSSSIAMVELKRLHEWLIVMENTTEKFRSPECFRSFFRISPKFQVCLSHPIDKSFLTLIIGFYLRQAMHSTLADFRHKSFCRESRYNTEQLLSCYVGHFKSTCSIPTRSRYTTIHSNPSMEVCTLFSSEMTRRILEFRKLEAI